MRSWKRGNARVKERVLNFNLSSDKPLFEASIPKQDSGNNYLVRVKRNPLPRSKFEHWGIELVELDKKSRPLTENLLTVERPGSGGDNFPAGDLVGYLYPKENPNFIKDRRFFYPIRETRIVQIESFCLSIQVTNYKMKESDSKKIESLQVSLGFYNDKGRVCVGDLNIVLDLFWFGPGRFRVAEINLKRKHNTITSERWA